MNTADGSSGEAAAPPRRKRKRAQADDGENGDGTAGGDPAEAPDSDEMASKVKTEPKGYVNQDNNFLDGTRDDAVVVLDAGDHVDNVPDDINDDVEENNLMEPQIKTEPK